MQPVQESKTKMRRLEEKGGGGEREQTETKDAWEAGLQTDRSGSGSQNSPQRSRILMPIRMGVLLWSYIDRYSLSMLMVVAAVSKRQRCSFHWSLTAAIDNDQSICKEQDVSRNFCTEPPGLSRQLIVRCLHHGEGEFLDGTMDFALLPEYFGGSFDRNYAKKLVVEAFEEDKTRV
ncbi:hypothetical protein THAOC_09599 [Thalassiosira oceanica]|uniref:Uncharacterized protein n=1 Tax=Thalassiosira oceanica TaxID=159749 RepID=K0SSA1_THAOC|nr:hypothetical protein THAOC_09599 [Thalassiosira oceanica]|eukprot:EJK69173.1 hypothetical protein THAOC_09599 [Thalassiosira oceanica]